MSGAVLRLFCNSSQRVKSDSHLLPVTIFWCDLLMTFDILIINGRLLPMSMGSNLLPAAYIAVNNGVIVDVGAMTSLPAKVSSRQIIDATGGLVMPGLVNTHAHAAMTLFRGLADDLPLTVWLHKHIFPAESKFVQPEMVYWCSKLAAAEMIMSGTTTVADGYFFADQAAQAFSDTGIRAVTAHGVIDFPAPGVIDPADNIKAAAEHINRWQFKNNLITPAVFCHSPYTVSSETLQKAKALAVRNSVPFFIHLAETNEEITQIKDRYSVTPVRYLADLNILDATTICVHCVWLTPDDIKILHLTNSKVVSCPESNMKLAAGVAPLPDLLAEGVVCGLGTDGCASNNDLDLFREMDSCAKLHKVKHLDPTVMPAAQVLQMATLGGARVLGLDKVIGSLEVGKRADIIVIDLNQPHLTPFYNADIVVYAASGRDVSTVIIDGRLIMDKRRLLTFDLQEVMERVNSLSKECW